MGKRITHMGPAGSGQVTKACNQILCAVNLLGVCEALAIAKRSGLDLERMHQVVTGGAANSWSLENLGKAAGEAQIFYRPLTLEGSPAQALCEHIESSRKPEIPLLKEAYPNFSQTLFF